jgi:hypothetical protein
MEDAGDHLNVVKFRDDLSGPPLAPGARAANRRNRVRNEVTSAPAVSGNSMAVPPASATAGNVTAPGTTP